MIFRTKLKIQTLLILSYLTGSTLFTVPVYADENNNAPQNSEIQTEIIEPQETLSEDNQNELINPQHPTEKIYHKTIFSLLGEPKYQPNFNHVDYANPDAPKRGIIKLAEIGSFDNFNGYASRGTSEQNSTSLYDTLFTNSADDITSFYPLIATSITYSDNYRWAEVTINSNAKFQDETPITAEDVEFTFHKFMTEGVSQYRVYNQGITVKAIASDIVRIEVPETDREKLLSFVGTMPVIPKHFWQDHNLSEPINTPPMGSGPYYISDYKIGQYAVYQRNPHYWAADLPINKGLYNFDQKRIEYYMDNSIALEAFKAGEYDFRGEAQPKNWFTQYQGKYFDSGFIIRQEDPVKTAINTQWLAFNLQKEQFKDIKVRQALTLAFDFDWLNNVFYYGSYKRPNSFFENTIYAARGKPSEQELKWLEPFKNIIPEAVFGESYHLPKSKTDGFNRSNLLKATELLKEAGWIVKDGKLINQKSGKPFEFELLTYMGSDIKYAIPFQQNLARLGITMKIVSLDYAQITRRLRERDYDMMPRSYSAINYPTSDLIILWGSQYLNSSWNGSGLHNEAIDSIIADITNNQDNQAELIPLGRALDRILTQEYPMIPMWYPSKTYYAYWNKFGQPAIKPLYSIGIDSWWYDVRKAANLPKNQEH